MLARTSRVFRGFALFALLVLLGAMPSVVIRTSFSQALCAICNGALLGARFSGGVQAEMEPLGPHEAPRAGQNVEEDTRLLLHAPGRATKASLGLSLRRDAYLPLVIFLAAVFTLPSTRRAKAASIAVGIPSVVAVAVASIWLLVTQITSQLPGVTAGWRQPVSAFMFERWLTPPGNRVIAPLLLAAALGMLFHRRFQPRLAMSPDSSPAPSSSAARVVARG